jgi:hypothetical protein
MYTFQPLADIPVTHGGFEFICFLIAIAMIVVLLNDAGAFLETFFVCTVIAVVSYGVSFHWIDQATQTFANTQVQAKFVGYQPEGYREKSGKSMVDRHYMYVVYMVNGNPVILQGQVGIEYPTTAILYKN